MGRWTEAIYALSADKTTAVFAFYLANTAAVSCFRNAHALSGGKSISKAPQTERITHYTLQAKSCLAASGEDISSLYIRIYKDYKDSQTPIPDIFHDMYQSQQDFFAKGLYRFILSTVIDRMAPLFDKEMRIEADSNQYEYIPSAPSEQTNITLPPVEDDNNDN